MIAHIDKPKLSFIDKKSCRLVPYNELGVRSVITVSFECHDGY